MCPDGLGLGDAMAAIIAERDEAIANYDAVLSSWAECRKLLAEARNETLEAWNQRDAAIAQAEALAEALHELLNNYDYAAFSDDELRSEARLGNGFAPIILAARAALRKARGETDGE